MFRRLELLRFFLAVAEAGGIRQASEIVHLSQSALTRRIQDLESDLGVVLFDRTSRGMTLTRPGEMLLHHARQIDLACSYATEEISELLEGAAGSMRVGGGPAWAYAILPDAIAALQAQFPKVHVELFAWLNDKTLPMLMAGKLDLVLGGLPPADERDADLVYEPLVEIEHLVFAGSRHPLAGTRAVSAHELSHFAWVWFMESTLSRVVVRAFFERAGLGPPNSAVDITAIESGFRLLGKGDYLMLLPATLEAAARLHGLAVVPLQESVGTYPAGMIYRPSVERLKPFRALRDILRHEVGTVAGATVIAPR